MKNLFTTDLGMVSGNSLANTGPWLSSPSVMRLFWPKYVQIGWFAHPNWMVPQVFNFDLSCPERWKDKEYRN